MSFLPARTRRGALAALVLAPLVVAVSAPSASAQSLRGSRSSVERAYSRAKSRGLPFQRSERTIQQAAREGDYVRLVNGSGYRLRGVSVPFVLPATAAWVADMATQYRRACHAPMTVTSAMRPASRRLRNSIQESVHPTGMAVDLRAPRGQCRTWLRRTLLGMERRGTIDATEERFPAHFHVVVYGPRRAAPRAAARAKLGGE